MKLRNFRLAIFDLRLVSRWCVGLGIAAFGPLAHAEDWTRWGRAPIRSMISPEKNPPLDWKVPGGEGDKGTNILWHAELGSKTYGNPVISEGVVYVGTN